MKTEVVIEYKKKPFILWICGDVAYVSIITIIILHNCDELPQTYLALWLEAKSSHALVPLYHLLFDVVDTECGSDIPVLIGE